MVVVGEARIYVLTLKDPDGRWEVVDAPRSPQGSNDDGRRRHEIVGKAVVEVSLTLVSSIELMDARNGCDISRKRSVTSERTLNIPEAQRRRLLSQIPSHTCITNRVSTLLFQIYAPN